MLRRRKRRGGSALSYVDENLIEGEKVAYRTRLHWVVMKWPALAGLAAGVLAVGLLGGSISMMGGKSGHTETVAVAGLFLVLVAGGCFALGIILRSATELAVTSRRVMVKSGIFERKTFEMPLSRVESVSVAETMMGRMLGYGTVMVRGTGGTPESFELVGKPLEFQKHVQQQMGRGTES